MSFDKNGNFWAVKPADGQSRSHVPPQPLWFLFIRIAQLVLAIIIVGLTGYAASKFGTDRYETAMGSNGLSFSFFVFAWTVLFLGWLVASILFFPTAYNYWAHLAVEGLTVIFWLSSWAVLAANASKLNEYFSIYFSYVSASSARYSGLDTLKRCINCIKAAAGLGALQWILFTITLVSFVISLLQHRKTEAGQSPVTEPKPETATETAPTQQQPYPPQGQQYQQPYPQQQQAYPQQN